jgi:hypothetical protein
MVAGVTGDAGVDDRRLGSGRGVSLSGARYYRLLRIDTPATLHF